MLGVSAKEHLQVCVFNDSQKIRYAARDPDTFITTSMFGTKPWIDEEEMLSAKSHSAIFGSKNQEFDDRAAVLSAIFAPNIEYRAP